MVRAHVTPLTENFALEEFVRSQEASRRGIENVPTPEIFRNLIRLCDEILEPLRKAINRPIVISSGFRSPALNAAIGGALHSDHLAGRAADVTAPGISLDALTEVVHTISPYRPLKQCIREFPDSPGGGWLHVSVLPEIETQNKPEPEFLVATRNDDGTVTYAPWASTISA